MCGLKIGRLLSNQKITNLLKWKNTSTYPTSFQNSTTLSNKQVDTHVLLTLKLFHL